MKYLLDVKDMMDLLDMYDEYRTKHGYGDTIQAKAAAIRETTDPDAGYSFDADAIRARVAQLETENERLMLALDKLAHRFAPEKWGGVFWTIACRACGGIDEKGDGDIQHRDNCAYAEARDALAAKDGD